MTEFRDSDGERDRVWEDRRRFGVAGEEDEDDMDADSDVVDTNERERCGCRELGDGESPLGDGVSPLVTDGVFETGGVDAGRDV